MHSEIQDIIPYFSKFENILPGELIDIEIAEELGARNERNKIRGFQKNKKSNN
ncbi:hypothetical protein BH18THE2_BH18THE2_42310 [soil metagenome]